MVRSRSSVSGSGAFAMGISGFGAEVLDDDFLNVPVFAGAGAEWRAVNRRVLQAVSPMPIRMPVVNGTPSLPASSMVFSRRREFVGSVVVSDRQLLQQPRAGALQHEAEAGIGDTQTLDPTGTHQPRIGVRQAATSRATPGRTWLPGSATCCDSRACATGPASRESPPRACRRARTAPRCNPVSRPAWRPPALLRATWCAHPADLGRVERCSRRNSHGRDS